MGMCLARAFAYALPSRVCCFSLLRRKPSITRSHFGTARGELHLSRRDGLTVMPTPNTGASVTVQGTAADGTALVVDGDLVSGLTAGDNTVNVVVLAQNGTSDRYTLTVEVSDDVREVAAGDVISWPADCDSDIGCDGTLNGVDGRFVCVGGGFRTETANVQFSVGKICLLSLGAGVVVNSASGWAFAAFPASPR